MRRLPTVKSVLLALPLAICIGAAVPAAAAEPYCRGHARSQPVKVPHALAPAVAKAFQIDAGPVGSAAFIRCTGGRLMACYVGANLNCGRADRRRRLGGATAWCREHPGSANIPMAVTGHATVYSWSCRGRRAIAGPSVFTVDRQGYVGDNWREIR
jgi:hypothetical protein